jgi:PAS domain S-box-containing protein
MTQNQIEFYAAPDFDLSEISPFLLDNIPIALTVIDSDGRILYFNRHSTRILDRKPEYLGRDVRACHLKPESIAKIDLMLEEFKNGRQEKFEYEIVRNGRRMAVTFLPLMLENKGIGCIQTVTVIP